MRPSRFAVFIRDFLFRHKTILIYKLNIPSLYEIKEQPLHQGVIRKGCLSELSAVRKHSAALPWEFSCHRFDGVTDFFIAIVKGQIQHISWIYYQGDPNRFIQLGPRDAEIKYSLTLPEFRGRGLYAQALKAISRHLIQKGFRNIFICVDAANQASIRGIEKAGFVYLTKIRLRKILGVQLSKKYVPKESSPDSIDILEITYKERDLWDRAAVKFNIAHPFNAYAWGGVRAIDGWKSSYIMAKRKGEISGLLLLLIKSIPLTGLSIMYAPRGPVFHPQDQETFRALLSRVLQKARRHRAIFFRIDPNISEENIRKSAIDPFIAAGFVHLDNRWSMWNAPCDVYRTDLSKSHDVQQLFARINAKARTGIRKAKKDGVIIQTGTSLTDIAAFYRIFKQFALKKGFMYRPLEYQKQLFYEYISNGQGALFLSNYKGSLVGGQICIRLGPMCVEMHRCVDYQYHKHRINEALVWEGMKWAKKNGCTWYCQRGEGSPTLAKFKEKFDADIVHLVGYYDLPFRRKLYSYFTLLEFKLLPALVSLVANRLKNLHKVINHFN
ncbi:MAG: peptidoglycan bridge formation glycyltransferase FemA/FemB family protein [Deltaproteobacteria bacterium]|nr:peptidoglycan bridge formation glycyltransferase FemA/FemB family protein [Deltaproteobacteria bacterium]